MNTKLSITERGKVNASKRNTRDIMWQILPIIILPMATIAIAYILEFSTYLLGQTSGLWDSIPDWTPTILLAILVLATYRSVKASLSQDT